MNCTILIILVVLSQFRVPVWAGPSSTGNFPATAPFHFEKPKIRSLTESQTYSSFDAIPEIPQNGVIQWRFSFKRGQSYSPYDFKPGSNGGFSNVIDPHDPLQFLVEGFFTDPNGKTFRMEGFWMESIAIDKKPLRQPDLDAASWPNNSSISPLYNGDPHLNPLLPLSKLPHAGQVAGTEIRARALPEKNWAIRFSPGTTGEWTYIFKAKNLRTTPATLAIPVSGKFRVIASNFASPLHFSQESYKNDLATRFPVDDFDQPVPLLGVNYQQVSRLTRGTSNKKLIRDMIRQIADHKVSYHQIRQRFPAFAGAFTDKELRGLRNYYVGGTNDQNGSVCDGRGCINNRQELFSRIAPAGASFWDEISGGGWGSFAYEPDLAALAKGGVNLIRTFLDDAGPKDKGFDGLGLETKLGIFDQADSERIDRLMLAALRNKIYVHGIFLLTSSFDNPESWYGASPSGDNCNKNPESKKKQWNPYNQALGGPVPEIHRELFFSLPEAKRRFKNRLRYISSRYPHANLAIFDIGGELNRLLKIDKSFKDPTIPLGDPCGKIHECNSLSDPCGFAAWHSEMGAYIKSLYPRPVIVTTGVTDSNINDRNAKQFLVPEIDLIHVTRYTYGIPLFSAPFVGGQLSEPLLHGIRPIRHLSDNRLSIETIFSAPNNIAACGNANLPCTEAEKKSVCTSKDGNLPHTCLNGVPNLYPKLDGPGTQIETMHRERTEYQTLSDGAAVKKPFLIGEAGVFEPEVWDASGHAFHDLIWSSTFSGSIGNAIPFPWDELRVQQFYNQFKPLSELLQSAKRILGDDPISLFDGASLAYEKGSNMEFNTDINKYFGDPKNHQSIYLMAGPRALGFVKLKTRTWEALGLSNPALRHDFGIPATVKDQTSLLRAPPGASFTNLDAPNDSADLDVLLKGDEAKGKLCFETWSTTVPGLVKESKVILADATTGSAKLHFDRLGDEAYGSVAFHVYPEAEGPNRNSCRNHGTFDGKNCFVGWVPLPDTGKIEPNRLVKTSPNGSSTLVRSFNPERDRPFLISRPVYGVSLKSNWTKCPRGFTLEGGFCVGIRGPLGSTGTVSGGQLIHSFLFGEPGNCGGSGSRVHNGRCLLTAPPGLPPAVAWEVRKQDAFYFEVANACREPGFKVAASAGQMQINN